MWSEGLCCTAMVTARQKGYNLICNPLQDANKIDKASCIFKL